MTKSTGGRLSCILLMDLLASRESQPPRAFVQFVLFSQSADVRALNPLIGLRRAIIIRLDAAAVENDAAADGGEVGLGPQGPAYDRTDLGLNAGGPAGAVGLAPRRRDPDMARMRGRGEHRVQFVAQQLLHVGLWIELPRLGWLSQHEVGKFCTAVGRAASRQRHCCARHYYR